MGTLLEAIGIVLETHFRFGSQMGLPVGDSLSSSTTYVVLNCSNS